MDTANHRVADGIAHSYLATVTNLSVVIPAFNESTKIARDICSAAEFLETSNLCGEILVIDDGSSDPTSAVARDARLPSSVSLVVMRNDRHSGKGFALRRGVMASHGDFVAFADSGLTVPFDDALRGLHMLQEGVCEIAHGSRRFPGSVIVKEQDWDRRIASRLFHWTVMRLMHLPNHLTDTQCGFKIYRGDVARSLFSECSTRSFMFDVELIVRAQIHGYRIGEFPVTWTCDRDSRLSFLGSPWHILAELGHIRRTLVLPMMQRQI